MALLRSTAAPRTIIDPADSSLTASIPGTVTFSDPRKATNAKGENWREAATARFVPRDPEDLDAYDAVYAWCWTHFPRFVLCDEAGIPLPAQGAPRAARRYLIMGAKRMLGHLANHTRPYELNKHVIGSAQHIFTWWLPAIEDRRYLAQCASIPLQLLETAMLEAAQRTVAGVDGEPKGGFVWWQQAKRTLTICPPLTVR